MKKAIIYFCFSLILFITATTNVMADSITKCYYTKDYTSYDGNGNFSVGRVEVEIRSNKDADWVKNVTMTNYKGPKVGNGAEQNKNTPDRKFSSALGTSLGFMSGGLVGAVMGNVVGGQYSDVIASGYIHGIIDYKNEVAFKEKKIAYGQIVNGGAKTRNNWLYTSNDNKELSLDVSSSNHFSKRITDENFCPAYVVITASDIPGSTNVYQAVFVDDASLKDEIINKASQNKKYNYAISGLQYESKAEAGDGSSDEEEEEVNYETCEGMLGNLDSDGNYEEDTVGYLIQMIFDYMKIAAIIGVFVFSVIDYAKALIAQDDTIFKKANINTIKRIIFGIIFFLLPIIVDLILKVIDTSTCGIK